MKWKQWLSGLSGQIIWTDPGGGIGTGECFLVVGDLTIRRNDGAHHRFIDETLLAGPFESLDAAKAAYLVMVS